MDLHARPQLGTYSSRNFDLIPAGSEYKMAAKRESTGNLPGRHKSTMDWSPLQANVLLILLDHPDGLRRIELYHKLIARIGRDHVKNKDNYLEQTMTRLTQKGYLLFADYGSVGLFKIEDNALPIPPEYVDPATTN